MKPFRWNIAKREQLGRLTTGERSPAYDNFVDKLRQCCARVMSYSKNGVLVFVGRSPESIYDYLSGVLNNTSKTNDLMHFNISNRHKSLLALEKTDNESIRALREHFITCGLSPEAILTRKQMTVFTDLVAYGGTFGNLAVYLFSWAKRLGLSLKDFRMKVGFLGITWRENPSPKVERWQQHVDWIRDLKIRYIKNISVPGSLWDYLGNNQMKVAYSNYPERWGSEMIMKPPRSEKHLKALRRAYDLYQLGVGEREKFAHRLSYESAIVEDWFRSLISELKGKSRRILRS